MHTMEDIKLFYYELLTYIALEEPEYGYLYQLIPLAHLSNIRHIPQRVMLCYAGQYIARATSERRATILFNVFLQMWSNDVDLNLEDCDEEIITLMSKIIYKNTSIEDKCNYINRFLNLSNAQFDYIFIDDFVEEFNNTIYEGHYDPVILTARWLLEEYYYT